MQPLKGNNLVHEERGIALAIINFLLNNLDKYDKINIENKTYFKIIRMLFPMFRVTRDYDNEDKSLNIYVRSRKRSNLGLVINNLDNIKSIHCKKKYFYLLPWFNVDNPILMFKFDKDESKRSREKIQKYVKKFNKIRLREISYETVPISSYKCGILFWDIFVEYQILNKYCRIMDADINQIYDLLTEYFGGFNCVDNQYVYLPYAQPYIQKEYVVVQPNETANAQMLEPTQVPTSQERTVPEMAGNTFMEKFVSIVSQKVGTLNNIMRESIKTDK